MTGPLPGCRVRLAALSGVSSPAMRDQVGKTGKVVSTRVQGGSVLVEARFVTPTGTDDVFWLKPAEYELVDGPTPIPPTPIVPVPVVAVPKETAMADFSTAVRTRIDQLVQADAALARQAEEIAAGRATNAKERKALEAALGAYGRVQDTGQRALPAPRRGVRPSPESKVWPVLERMLADGQLVRAEATEDLLAAGLYSTRASADTAVGVVLLRHAADLERVAKGVYKLREAS